jgi:hypothetical protein
MCEPSKPWCVNNFEKYRPEICSFVNRELIYRIENDDHSQINKIIVKAPVKSGKREIVEYTSMKDSKQEQTRFHAFISAWHRKADEEQRDELKKHNLEVFSIISNENARKFKEWIESMLSTNKKIVIHLDECDHGSGHTQKLSLIWNDIKGNKNISIILYSATPEEILFSSEIKDEDEQNILNDIILYAETTEYIPPIGYCGSRKFIEENLVFDAKPFFKILDDESAILSDQAKMIVNDLQNSMLRERKRNIIILRLSYYVNNLEKKIENKAIYQFIDKLHYFQELSNFLIIFDKDNIESIEERVELKNRDRIFINNVQWSKKIFWDTMTSDQPILVIIDQTSSRSTEWACHNRVFATHDFRKKSSYSIICQAQERVNHYERKYGEFQRIRVYGHLKSFILSASRDQKSEYENYLNNLWMIKKVKKPIDGFKIVKSQNPAILHPVYSEIYSTREEAEEILLNMDCLTEVNLSTRITGNKKTFPKIITEFHECNKENYESKKRELCRRFPKHNFIRNKFEVSEREGLIDGKYQGFLRRWKVFDYEEIRAAPGWGVLIDHPRIIICYRNNILGIALCINTGEFIIHDTLSAIKSMYGSRR